MAIASVNPATGETLRRFDSLGERGIEFRLARAAETFASYRCTDFATRASLMRAAAEILQRDANAFARTITLEMGKPIRAAVDEIKKCGTACEFYAENAEKLLAPVDAKSD